MANEAPMFGQHYEAMAVGNVPTHGSSTITPGLHNSKKRAFRQPGGNMFWVLRPILP